MNRKKWLAALLSVCLAAAISGCTSERATGSTAENSSAADTTTPAAETTTSASTEATTTKATEATTTTDAGTTTESGTTAPAQTTEPLATNSAKQDNDTKLLWSERGLEIVPIKSEDGYGEELRAGETYLDWTLESFDGFPTDDATSVPELHADFTYNEGTLAANGIMTILPDDHPDYPGGLYLRVDNQADFPYFPKDSRERGKFIILNAKDVIRMLELDTAEEMPKELAVSVSISTLHVHYSASGYDTIRVTAASKR